METARQPDDAALHALMAWWRDAGVDTAVSDQPFSWMVEAPLAREAPPALSRSAEPADLARVRGRAAGAPPSGPGSSAPLPAVPDEGWGRFATLADLLAAVRTTAPRCPILDGNADSGILVMGEAPSIEDLRTGRPFTGPAGHLLDRMLAAIGIDREKAAVSILCPRRTVPGPPPADAIARDLPLARALVRLMAPRAILLLGAVPSQQLLGDPRPIGTLRGRWGQVAVAGADHAALPTFNPAYLLRNPAAKADAWADLLAFQAGLRQR